MMLWALVALFDMQLFALYLRAQGASDAARAAEDVFLAGDRHVRARRPQLCCLLCRAGPAHGDRRHRCGLEHGAISQASAIASLLTMMFVVALAAMTVARDTPAELSR
jgi:hypothetical protein